MKKRTLCLLLALCLVVAMAPAALADDTTTPTPAPTPTPTPAAATTQNNDYIAFYLTKYTMAAGDTMGAICTARGISFDTYATIIKNVNKIASFNSLIAGRTYWLPSTVASTTGEYYAIYKHILVTGDTVYNLCAGLGINMEDYSDMILQLNDAKSLTGFLAGKPILLPIYHATPSATATPAAGLTPATPATPATGTVSGNTVAGGTTAADAAAADATVPGGVSTTSTSSSVTNPDGSVTTTTVTTTISTSEADNLFDASKADKYYLVPYTVKSGDTLIAICNAYKSSFTKNAELISTVNGLTSASVIMVGDKLWIPSQTAAGLSTGYYVVTMHAMAAGETVYGLCTAAGGNFPATYRMLTLLNDGVNFNTLRVGQKIAIPVYMGT